MAREVYLLDDGAITLDDSGAGAAAANLTRIHAILDAGQIPVFPSTGVVWVNGSVGLGDSRVSAQLLGETPAAGGLGCIGNFDGVVCGNAQSIKNLRVRAHASNTSGNGIVTPEIGAGGQHDFESVVVDGFPGHGFLLEMDNNSHFIACDAINCGGDGWHFRIVGPDSPYADCNAVDCFGLYAEGNGGNGFYNGLNRWTNWHTLSVDNGAWGFYCIANFVVGLSIRHRGNTSGGFRHSDTENASCSTSNICTVPGDQNYSIQTQAHQYQLYS